MISQMISAWSITWSVHDQPNRGRIWTQVLPGIKGPTVDVPPDKLYLMPEFPSQTVVPEHGEDNALSSGDSKSGMGKQFL